jgi:hypothetical protein
MDAQGEKALLLAIIIRSVLDMRGIVPGVKRTHAAMIQHEAMRWLVSERRDLGSFCWVCEELSLSASWLRRQLLALVSSDEKVSVIRTRKLDQSGQSQHDNVALGLYDQPQSYGGR